MVDAHHNTKGSVLRVAALGRLKATGKGKHLNKNCFPLKTTQSSKTWHSPISDGFDPTCEILTLTLLWYSTISPLKILWVNSSRIKLPQKKHAFDLQIFLERSQGKIKNFGSFNHKCQFLYSPHHHKFLLFENNFCMYHVKPLKHPHLSPYQSCGYWI